MITKCVVCRRFEGRSYPDVIPSALPASRVSDDPALTFVGVDFAGPLYVKGTPANKKSHLKDNGTKNFYLPDLSGLPMEYLISYFCLSTAYIVVKEYRNNTHEILTAVRHLEQIPRLLIYACDVDGWVSANSTV